MSDSGSEKTDRRQFREHISTSEFLYQHYGELIAKYQQAGKIGRWLLELRNPVASQIALHIGQTDSLDAQRHAYATEGETVII